MKISMTPQLHPRRGEPVKIGNVYANAYGFPHFKIVVGIIDKGVVKRAWNNVVSLHINSTHGIIGCSRNPERYLSEHNDLVGFVKDMPTLKIEWLRPHPQKDKLK